MRKNKKMLLALVGVFALVGIASIGANAYFTSQDKESTTFKVVKINTEIEEKIDSVNKKEITVKNVGNSECYVRVRITTSPQELINVVILDNYNANDWYEEKVDENQDGKIDYAYYYYKKVLETGKSTESLHSGYLINSELLQNMQLSSVAVDIAAYEESVQVIYPIDSKDPMKAILDSFKEYDQYTGEKNR